MSAFKLILKRNLQRRKTFSAAIVVLSFFATLFLITAIGIIARISNLYEESYIASGNAEIIYGFTDNYYSDDYISHFENKEQVENVEKEQAGIGVVSIEDDTATTVFSVYNHVKTPYNLQEKADDLADDLTSNEIVIPISFKADYGYKINDKIAIDGIEFVVKGICEDPIYGSPYYHTKRVFVSEEMLADLENNENLQNLTFLNVKLLEKYKEDHEKLKSTITELTNDFDKFQLLAFDQVSLASMRTTVPRIILVILAVFSLFLLVIMTIVIRYVIMVSIEDDYVTLGIMKALGFRRADISLLLVVQYLFTVFVGLLFGLIGSYFITPILGRLLLAASGILWRGNISILLIIAISMGFLLFVGSIVLWQTRKAGKISPIEAISSGRRIQIHSRKGILISKPPLNSLSISLVMSIKQLTTATRQYISLFLLSIIFSFMILTVIGLSGAFDSPEKVAGILGYDLNDLSLQITNANTTEQDIDKLVEMIDKEYGVNYYSVYDTNSKIYVDGNRIQLLVYSDFQTSNILKGTIPQNGKEVIISNGISEMLGKDIGDTIDISLTGDSNKVSYKVVGINNQIYRMGNNISMTAEGFKHIYPDFSPSEFLLKLGLNENLEQIIEKINGEYLKDTDGISVTNELSVTMKRVNAIQAALSAIMYGVIIISLVLIATITFLVSIVIIKRETINLGIMKSIGFTSRQARIQFAFRFGIIALLGSIIGMLLNLLSNNGLIDLLFRIVHIVSLPSGLSLVSILFDVFFIVISMGGFAWLVSRRIRKVNVRVLITD